ncbi:MAG: DUF4890 domain-containing protein [Prevotellaceae bacterium]|jgi:hypothetical protein|nr:DUF4890 domain-containing protein [Prevotellaceae bacterium]
MKKILMTLVVALFAGGVAVAQGPGMPDAKQMTDQMVQQYKLNDSQKTKLLEANKGFVEGLQKMFSSMTPGEMPSQETIQEMQKSREAYTTKLKGILTKEQFAAYEKEQQERMAGFGGGPR